MLSYFLLGAHQTNDIIVFILIIEKIYNSVYRVFILSNIYQALYYIIYLFYLDIQMGRECFYFLVVDNFMTIAGLL